MIDGIIKADGTSRLIRSELPATYEEFRTQCRAGTQPLDVLFNALGWRQIPTFLNKGNLASDGTLALFGLSANAVPDDALRVLSRFHAGLGNEYVWAKNSDDIEYVVEKSAEVQYASYDKTSSVTFYKTLTLSDAHEIVLSDSFQIPARQDASGFSTAIGCYSNYGGKFYQLTRVESDNYANSLYGNPLTVKEVGGGFVEFVNSPFADAYPPAESDGYTYTALGQLGNKVQVATGSYVGTGTYGSGNKNSLTFDFKPKFLVVFEVITASRSTNGIVALMVTGSPCYWISDTNMGLQGSNNVSWAGNTVSWFNNVNQTNGWDVSNCIKFQFNISGATYRYIAIG